MMSTTLPVQGVREESSDRATVALFGAPERIPRSEPRDLLNAPLWITSLHKPGVFEIVPTENGSIEGMQLATPRHWGPGQMVLVSSRPGLSWQDSAVYA